MNIQPIFPVSKLGGLITLNYSSNKFKLRYWAIRLTPVYTISCVPWLMLISTNVFPFYRANRNSLLDNSVKKFSPRSRRSSVEPKSEFIQIIIQVRYPYCTLMCSLQPPLQKSSHSINQRQQIITNIFRLTCNNMLISQSGQSSITIPAISAYRTARFYTLLDKPVSDLLPRHQALDEGGYARDGCFYLQPL